MARKTTGMTVIDLKKEIASDKLRPLYLLYGEEAYMRGSYEKRIAEKVPDAGFPEFNCFKFEGTETPLSDYDNAWEAFPMMTDRKLIIIRDCKIFKKVNEEQKKFWLEKFERLSEDTVVIFNETEIDKRGVLYKAVQKKGAAVEFRYQDEKDLITWVSRQALNAKLKITKDCASYLVGITDPGLSNLINEWGKLLSYCEGSVTKNDIDKVVSKAMSIQIFDLTNAIMERDGDTAMRMVSELRTSGESAFGILYLLYSGAEKLLKTKLCGSKNKYEVAQRIGAAPFVAGKYIDAVGKFPAEQLINMITGVPEADMAIKTGRMEQWAALELYIAQCIGERK